MTTNHAGGLTAEMSLHRIERLDEEIIELLARRRAMAQQLPHPARARAADPDFAETVRGITGR